MDRVPGEISFCFELAPRNFSGLRGIPELLLGVTGDFCIRVGGKILFEETEFCLVEFAAHAAAWLRRPPGSDFVYESMESEESELVWIKAAGDGWRVGSAHQTLEDPAPRSITEVRAALNHYISTLRATLECKHGLNIDGLLDGSQFDLS